MTSRPPIVLGTAQLATRYGITNRKAVDPPLADSLAVLGAAARGGVSAVDTAPVYGEAEDRIGASRDHFIVHTKLRPDLPVEESLASSRRRLADQTIGIVYLHDPDEVLDTDGAVLREARRLTARSGALLGASVYEEAQFDAALSDPSIGVVQVPLNLLDRRFAGEALERAAAAGTQVIARSALLQGALLARPDDLPDPVTHLGPYVGAVARIAASCGLSQLAVSVGWVLARSGLTGVVLGAADEAELGQLLAVAATPLDPEVVEALQNLDLPDPRACDPRLWATR